jgi:hypothetical protein
MTEGLGNPEAFCLLYLPLSAQFSFYLIAFPGSTIGPGFD